MTARNLALEALKELVAHFGEEHSGKFYEGGCALCIAIERAIAAIAAIAALEAETGEPVDCQFQGTDGRWHSFLNDQHKDNTIASGKWPIRNLYAAPPPAVSQWLPIETAPKTSKAILVHCAERKNTYTATWARDEEFQWSGKWKHFAGDFISEVATHWQPLPAAPGAPA